MVRFTNFSLVGLTAQDPILEINEGMWKFVNSVLVFSFNLSCTDLDNLSQLN